MPISRKEMLVRSESAVPELPQAKLEKQVAEGNAYISLVNNAGWKKLVKEYIEPNSSLDALWGVKDEDLPIQRAKMRVFKELLDYVEMKVNEAVKAFETLQNNREDK
jgi:hypothetical protein